LLEKRKLKRRHLLYYLSVIDDKTNQTLGRLVDITTHGLKLLSEDPIKSETDYNLTLILPEEIEQLNQISFKARSKRCDEGTISDFYTTGFQFSTIGNSEQLIIERLINEYEFPE